MGGNWPKMMSKSLYLRAGPAVTGVLIGHVVGGASVRLAGAVVDRGGAAAIGVGDCRSRARDLQRRGMIWGAAGRGELKGGKKS